MNRFEIDRLVSEVEGDVGYLRGLLGGKEEELLRLEGEVESKREGLVLLGKVNVFLNKSIESKISVVKHRVEEIINEGLRCVFVDRDVRVSVGSVFKNNRTNFFLNVIDGGVESSVLSRSFGGGVLCVIGFLFKVVVNILLERERFMVMDESLNYVSRDYQEGLAVFISRLCKEMGVCIVLVSHQKLLADNSDLCYESVYSSGGTEFREL